MPGGRKPDKEPGKSAATAPPIRLGLSDKTAQAVFVDTEVSRGSICRRHIVGAERDSGLIDTLLACCWLLFEVLCCGEHRLLSVIPANGSTPTSSARVQRCNVG